MKRGSKKLWGPPGEFFKFDSLILDFCKADIVGKASNWLSSNDKNSSNRTNDPYKDTTLEDCDSFYPSYRPRTLRSNKGTGFRVTYARNRGSTIQHTNNSDRSVYNRGRRSNIASHGRQNVDRFYQNRWFRKPSVPISKQWKIIEEIPFQQLSNVNLSQIPQATNYHEAGSVFAYNKSYDNVRPKEAIPVIQSDYLYPKVCTCEDPIIREGISVARVFGTDTVISTLMAASRTVAPWDIVIHRVSNLLFFDKRAGSDIDLPTVNETSFEPGYDQHLNSPTALSLEASRVNQYYSQQCLLKHTKKIYFGRNPFFSDQKSAEIPSVAYRYRLFDLGDDLKILVRCEFDAYSIQNKVGINIKTLMEWGSKPTMKSWRYEFEKFSGSILASEIKNNTAKIAKWTSSAIMAGDNIMKIGFVSRKHYFNNKEHSIIGSSTFNSQDLADQIGLNMKNAWGIVRSLSKRFLELPEGKYLLVKDPSKPLLRLYSIPDKDLNLYDENEEEETLSDSKDFNDQYIKFDNLC